MLNAKNLLIAAAIGLPIESIKHFIVSFRKVNQEDTFVVLVDENTKNNSDELFLKYFVDAVVCDPKKYNTSPINSRHFFYLDYIAHHPEYKNVLISDSRDLVFQKNPFSDCLDSEHIFAFEEDPNFGLIHEGNNRGWIRNIYGEQRMQELAQKPILCCGALLGSRNAMLDMLKIMCKEMLQINPDLFSWTVADQPVLNHICYSNLSQNLPLTIKKNGEVVGNLCLCLVLLGASNKIHLDILSNIVYVDGKIPSIVHQYDRSLTLSSVYDRIHTL